MVVELDSDLDECQATGYGFLLRILRLMGVRGEIYKQHQLQDYCHWWLVDIETCLTVVHMHGSHAVAALMEAGIQ